MPSLCFGSISWCFFVAPLFHCSSYVPLIHSGIPTVPPVFRCSTSVAVFRQRYGFSSLFCCSVGAPCSVVPCSVLPRFIVCLKNLIFAHKSMTRQSALILTRNVTRCNNRDDLLRLISVWKFQYFLRPIYNPAKHLRWIFYCENSKPLSIFTKKAPL